MDTVHWYGMVWYGTVWYGCMRLLGWTLSTGIVWYGMVWYGTVWLYEVIRMDRLQRGRAADGQTDSWF